MRMMDTNGDGAIGTLLYNYILYKLYTAHYSLATDSLLDSTQSGRSC